MSQKLVLIDGHSILNRAFYGVPDLSNAEGLHTNAIYGFLNIMFKILEEEKPDYLAVAFDVHAPTFRHQMYQAYKGTRKPMPEELRQQVPVMKEVLKAMHITIMEQAGLEADDILGTLAKKAEQEGMEVSLVSGDRDLLQIATDHIKIRIPKTKQGRTEIEDYYAADVQAAYQVTPLQFIELKALMGDTADNIPEYGFHDWNSCLATVGHGGLKESQIVNRMYDEYRKDHPITLTDQEVLEAVGENKQEDMPKHSKSGIVVKGLYDVAVHFSKCCSPVPGDEIVGFVTRGRGVSIHRTDCVNILHLSDMERVRLIEAEWQEGADKEQFGEYHAEIKIFCHDRSGLLVDITKVFTEAEINISGIHSKTSKQGIATIDVAFQTKGRGQITKIVEKIRQIESVMDVERTTG